MFNFQELLTTIRKNVTRRDILIAAGLLLLFLLTRLINLTKFPIFNDEGIYIHWAKVAWHDANWRFISLTDGKQPLQTWATIPLMKFFPDKLLLAGRLFAVESGLFALAGIFTLTTYLFNKRTGFIAALLYILMPYFIFFDRIAMVDSFVNASAIWIFFFSLLLINTLRLDVALLYGMLAGIFLLAKTNVSLFFGLSIFAPLTQLFKGFKKTVPYAFNFYILFALSFVIAFAIYNIQRLSPFLHFVNEKSFTFILTPKEVVANPFQVLFFNLWHIPFYILHNLGWTTGLLGLYGIGLITKQNKYLGWYMIVTLIIPFIILSFFMKVLSARYIIFFTPLFIVGAAFAINSILNRYKNLQFYILYSLFIILFSFTLYFDYTMIFKPADIPFPEVDRGQYVKGWPAGWGMQEIITYAREKSQEKPVIIIAEGNFGMAGDVLDSLLKRNDKISIKPYWPLDRKNLAENQKELKDHYVFVVYPHTSTFDMDLPLKLIKRYDKPGNESSIYFFELTGKR